MHLNSENVVTPWLPDETVYSWVARYHMRAGHVRAAQTGLSLFGHRTRGCAHDLPAGIDEFVDRTAGQLGDADSVIVDHTVLPLYLALACPEKRQGAISALRGSGIGSLKFQLGLLTSRFRACHPLKACADCMTEDLEQHCTAYWHRAHQLPGVWTCPTHGRPLQVASVKWNGVGRFLLYLPATEMLGAPYADTTRTAETAASRLASLAEIVLGLVDVGASSHLDPQHMHLSYRWALRERGWIKGERSLRWDALSADYVGHCEPLRNVAELAALPASAKQATAQLGRLLYGHRQEAHVLRHAVMIHWLFGSWQAFAAQYVQSADRQYEPEIRDETPQSSRAVADPRRAVVLSAIVEGGCSMRGAAQRAGVDATTAMAWAAAAGIGSRRRGKVLSPTKRSRLHAGLRKGMSKSDAALQFGISLQTVTRQLRTEPGLAQAWADARWQSAQASARLDWERATRRSPLAGAKVARLLAPAAYAWLYRNDRAWLRASIGQLPRPYPQVTARVDWDERDRTLSQLVQHAALELASNTSKDRTALWQLYQAVPELRSKLNQLERLPLTCRAIVEALGRRRQTRTGIVD